MSAKFIFWFARRHLHKILEESGSVLYSGVESLRVGNVYLLGTNPGGSPEIQKDDTIGKHLKGWNSDSNEYWDKPWGYPVVGQNPLQRRVRWLLCELSDCECGDSRINNGKSDSCLGRKICASNLIFLRSPELAKLKMDAKEAADMCWNVHDDIMSHIVLPKVIVAFGWSYWYLREKFIGKSIGSTRWKDEAETPEETLDANHNNMKCRRFATMVNFTSAPRPLWIFGIPHLSRYAINLRCPQISNWIREKLPPEIVERELDLAPLKLKLTERIQLERCADGFTATLIDDKGQLRGDVIAEEKNRKAAIEHAFRFLRRGWQKAYEFDSSLYPENATTETIERKLTLDDDTKEVMSTRMRISRSVDGDFIATPLNDKDRLMSNLACRGKDKNNVIEQAFFQWHRGLLKAIE